MRRVLLFVVVLLAPLLVAAPARAEVFPSSIPLPVDFQPEGVATGPGTTFYAGSLRTGDIYRGDLRTGAGEVFVHAPAGRAALGLKVDVAHSLLFVAGGATGTVYVYSTTTGATVAALPVDQQGAFLNDVVLTPDAAWFTDTFAPVLYRVPISLTGAVGAPTTLHLSGPAATITDSFNLNGIEATPDGRTLIVNHTALGQVFTVDPVTGASALIDVDGLIPGTPDGLLLQGCTLWVVENFANTVVGVTLTPDLSSGRITTTITDSRFENPTTAARHGNRLVLVNGRFDLAFPPPFGPGAPQGTTFDLTVVTT